MRSQTNPEVFTRGFGKKIAMVDLRYPYGKQKVYMSGSLFTAAARFLNTGCDVEVLDFNIDTPDSAHTRKVLASADLIGVSVVGSPYMQQLVQFCRHMKALAPDTPVLLGGQVMLAFSDDQFRQLFSGTNAILIKADSDLVPFGFPLGSLPKWSKVAIKPVLETLGDERLKIYLSHEMPLVVSQGCKYNCSFCAAHKASPENFKDLDSFAVDLKFMTEKARDFGIEKLEFYATNLDFFQTPEKLAHCLRAIAAIRRESGVDIKVRALACMNSFLDADKALPNLKELLAAAGFWCVGFGVDGPTKEIWKILKKGQNREDDVPKAMAKTAEMGLTTEILMIMGDKHYDLRLLIKTIHFCYGFIIDWKHTVLRLHVSKVLPGSADWYIDAEYVNRLLENPSRFDNLDVLALASKITHPDTKQRRQVNLAYLAIMLPMRAIKRCVSSTILPQGERSLFGSVARVLNPFMPYDR
jgi:hypothetical protein